MNRRQFLTRSLGGLLLPAAPAICRAEWLMPVVPLAPLDPWKRELWTLSYMTRPMSRDFWERKELTFTPGDRVDIPLENGGYIRDICINELPFGQSYVGIGGTVVALNKPEIAKV